VSIKPPRIDNRDQQFLVEQIRKLVLRYCPELENMISPGPNDPADTAIQIFSRMMEIIIKRLNRVPDKNFLCFLDLMGIRLSPPRVARAPLTFTMAAGASQYGFVPAGTQVAGTQAKDQKAVVFETEKDITVILPKPVRAASLDPGDDRWTNHSPVFFDNERKEAEVLFKGKVLVPHRIYLGHKKLFGFKEKATITLNVNLKKDVSLKDWEVKWYRHTDDSSDPVPLTVSGDVEAANLLKSGSITFKDVSGIAEKTLTGFDGETGLQKSWTSNWIFAELNKPVSRDQLPEIETIKASVEVGVKPDSSLSPDLAFFNNFPLDLTKDFYPFGERPKFNDTFYIASEEVFSKKDSKITITINLSEGVKKPDPERDIELTWEFWNGDGWNEIGRTTQKGTQNNGETYNFNDPTKAFTTSGKVTFTCPAIKPVSINGKESYWIRVRIIGGNYGDEATYSQQTTNGQTEWAYIPPTYRPPSISSFKMHYSFTSPEEDIETILTYNDFLYQDQSDTHETSDRFFTPFRPVTDKEPALYLGFDHDIGTLPVTIYFPLLGNVFTSYEEGQNQNPPIVAWEYWTGKEWSILSVEDNTMNLTKREMVQFLAPDDITRRPCFGEEYYWIRVRLEQGAYAVPPKLSNIYTNTVWGHNLVTVHDEILGSSNGQPGQVFRFAQSPVLPGQRILVRETALTEKEKAVLFSEEGKDAVTEIRDEADNIVEIWVRWHEVNNFYFSKPDSRHYVIDRNNGTITFGDGERGMIPPAGKDNLKCSRYQYGGGARGNVKAGTLTKLRTTFPYIDSVTNPDPADGGFDQEDLDHVRIRGPQTIKHRDRAVTYEDFEWLVREASPKVAKVKCLPTTDPARRFAPGWVTIIVVPMSEDAKPLPSQELLREIEEYIFARTSTYLTMYPSQVNLIGPGYIRVGVEASVRFSSISEAKIIEGRIIDNLKKFFHPLYGGPEDNGWGFGRDVYISECYEVIEKTEGVDYVEDLSLKASVQIYSLTLEKSFNISTSYPRSSIVKSVDGRMVFSLAEGITANSKIKTLRVTGFKEGDRISLGSEDDRVLLVIKSVSGDILECEPSTTEETGRSYPVGSIVETPDKRVRSFILNEVPAQDATWFLKVAVLEPGDVSVLSHMNNTVSMEIETVSDQVETVFIEDNYLVYSGVHLINRKGKEELIFPYLLNTHTGEIHDLKNLKPNCRVSRITREHRMFLRTLDKALMQKRGLDYCRWCFGADLSRD